MIASLRIGLRLLLINFVYNNDIDKFIMNEYCTKSNNDKNSNNSSTCCYIVAAVVVAEATVV